MLLRLAGDAKLAYSVTLFIWAAVRLLVRRLELLRECPAGPAVFAWTAAAAAAVPQVSALSALVLSLARRVFLATPSQYRTSVPRTPVSVLFLITFVLCWTCWAGPHQVFPYAPRPCSPGYCYYYCYYMLLVSWMGLLPCGMKGGSWVAQSPATDSFEALCFQREELARRGLALVCAGFASSMTERQPAPPPPNAA